MKFRDAIQTGLPLKRPCHAAWLHKRDSECLLYDQDGHKIEVDEADATADDWQVLVEVVMPFVARSHAELSRLLKSG